MFPGCLNISASSSKKKQNWKSFTSIKELNGETLKANTSYLFHSILSLGGLSIVDTTFFGNAC